MSSASITVCELMQTHITFLKRVFMTIHILKATIVELLGAMQGKSITVNVHCKTTNCVKQPS